MIIIKVFVILYYLSKDFRRRQSFQKANPKLSENNTKDKLNFGFTARHNHEALTMYEIALKVMKNMTNLQCFLKKLGNNFILSECSRG